jgi:glycosyltransferase involved in cell wall biosynthesis
MRIIIDLQGAQAENRARGIGRYTLSLAKAIARNRKKHEILIVLNSQFQKTIEPIRTAFDGLLPQDNIRVWHVPISSYMSDDDGFQYRKAAEIAREAFLASLKPDVIIVTSLFEGFMDAAVTSVGLLNHIPTAVVLYDLIPLIHRHPYLDDILFEGWYETKLCHLRRANLLLAISASSGREGMNYLSFSPEQVAIIGSAVDPGFKQIAIPQEMAVNILARLGLIRPFVMYTGGIDHRKNLERLIVAFSLLPEAVKNDHQLAIVCTADKTTKAALINYALRHNITKESIIITGYVPENDLIALYNLCAVFIFPSWHEGFGLPALEAMACGAPVIASNNSSLPEVVGLEACLFDPFDVSSIAQKLTQILTDKEFCKQIIEHGLQQSTRFSWDDSAQRAIVALEGLSVPESRQIVASFPQPLRARRPKLAYVSPLPPVKSGISDYSVELLPELARFYDIELIVEQKTVQPLWLQTCFPIRTVSWFRQNAHRYDRVLYHFGNSSFHQHMFDLLPIIPGVVVLHDFFLSEAISWLDKTGRYPGCLAEALYYSHGYIALEQFIKADSYESVTWDYPCNREILDDSIGVIVHSDYSRYMAKKWFFYNTDNEWAIIPLLRIPANGIDREEARHVLNLHEDDFIVCSFGIIGKHKLNHRLLEVWIASPLAQDSRCKLIFVGENDNGDYGATLIATIRHSGLGDRIKISGWTSTDIYHKYLAAADVAVQLRSQSRGETSAAALDCMNYKLVTIVNANGSMVDLPRDAIWMLADAFENGELLDALEVLWRDKSLRLEMSKKSRETILSRHSPRACVEQYYLAIEEFYKKAHDGNLGAMVKIGQLLSAKDDAIAQDLAICIAQNTPQKYSRQLLVDISGLMDLIVTNNTPCVVRSNILRELLTHQPNGYRVEPIYTTTGKGYCYARAFTLRFLGCPEIITDDPIDFQATDLFLGFESQSETLTVQQKEFYRQLCNNGVKVLLLTYDLLFIQHPEWFIPGGCYDFEHWIYVITQIDDATRIPQDADNCLKNWCSYEMSYHY